MIAMWMLSALLFTALVGCAAWFAEWALRLSGRQTRWPWLVALVVAVAWPIAAPFVRRAMPSEGALHQVATRLPAIQVLPDALPDASPWTNRFVVSYWIAASLLAIVRLLYSHRVLARVRRAARPHVVDGVPVLLTADVGPAVVGVVAPRVLLPEPLLDLDANLRALVLRHEIEHCRAGDPWILLGSALAVVLVPWNLALRWIVRRARMALEVDCDARVIASGANATQYGRLLLLVAHQRTLAGAPMLAASSAHLERRIDIMQSRTATRRRSRIALASVATVVLIGAACSSSVRGPVAAPKPVATTNANASDKVYFEFQVEKQVRQVQTEARVQYPPELKAAKVEGEVLAQFVVNADGKYDAGSFKVLMSSHKLFTDAVATALPDLRFTPAVLGGAPVRQLVQQPFTFSLSKNP